MISLTKLVSLTAGILVIVHAVASDENERQQQVVTHDEAAAEEAGTVVDRYLDLPRAKENIVNEEMGEFNRELNKQTKPRQGDNMFLYEKIPTVLEYSAKENDFRMYNDTKVINMYDPKCQGCQEFAPLYAKMTQDMAKSFKNLKVYAINCVVYELVCVEEYAKYCFKNKKKCIETADTGFPAVFGYPAKRENGNFVETSARSGGYPTIGDIARSLKSRRRLTAAASSEEPLYTDESNVMEYEEGIKDDFEASSRPKIVQLYDSSSSSCKAFKPRFVELADELKDVVDVYAIDCTKHEETCMDAFAGACVANPESCFALAREGSPAILAYPEHSKDGNYVPRPDSNVMTYDMNQVLESLEPASQTVRKLDGVFRMWSKELAR